MAWSDRPNSRRRVGRYPAPIRRDRTRPGVPERDGGTHTDESGGTEQRRRQARTACRVSSRMPAADAADVISHRHHRAPPLHAQHPGRV